MKGSTTLCVLKQVLAGHPRLSSDHNDRGLQEMYIVTCDFIKVQAHDDSALDTIEIASSHV